MKKVNSSLIITSLQTLFRKISGRSDFKRWGNTLALSPDWDSRTQRIANLILPGSSVVEFGAGRMVLKDMLPDNCQYTPSDIVDRGEGTIVCDLNIKPLPKFDTFNVAVFSGVLEYINDVPSLIKYLSPLIDSFIVSYAVLDNTNNNRLEFGWVNSYDSKQFIEIFEVVGYHCDSTENWREQVIYKFSKL